MLFTATAVCSGQPAAPAVQHKIVWPRLPGSWSIVVTVTTREDYGVSLHVAGY